MGTEAKRLLPSVSSRGKGLKIEANLTTPMTTTATTGCTAAEREQEHRDTEAKWKGMGRRGMPTHDRVPTPWESTGS
jgi:hypothetical protein